VLTAGRWGRQAPEWLQARHARLPRRVAEATRVTTPQAAIAAVAALVLRTTRTTLQERSHDVVAFRVALAAYSLHGITHVVHSAALGSTHPASQAGCLRTAGSRSRL
jgi:hypothetical protein